MRGANARRPATDLRSKNGVPKPKARRFGRRYTWDKWLKEGSFVLVRGRDFTCMTHGMAQMIRNVASKKGFRVSIRIVSNDRIEVTAFPRPGRKKEKA
jgi:hypothetical protein